MAFINTNSCPCTKEELELFTISPTQTVIESGKYSEAIPIAAITPDAPIQFTVDGSGVEYIDLANSMIYAKIQLVNGTGVPVVPAAHAAPINNVLGSLWSDLELKLNGTIVASSNGLHSYRSYIENLLTFSGATKKSQLQSIGYAKDDAGRFDEGDTHANPPTNSGLSQRYDWVSGGRHFEMLGKIHTDLAFQSKLLPPEVRLELKLTPAKGAFNLMSDEAAAAYRIKILECKLLIRKVKVSDSLYLAHAKALQLSNMRYQIRRVSMKQFTLPAGIHSHSQENVTSGATPSRIIIGLVDNTAVTGSYATNPFKFSHFDLRELKLLIGGQPDVTVRPMKLNYPAGLYIDGYVSIFQGSGKFYQDESLDISRSDYSQGYTLYAFDLSPDLSESSHFSLQRDSALRIDLLFGTATPGAIAVICFLEYDSVIEINRNRNVLVDFSTT